MRIYPCSIDRARRPKTGRPHRIVQLGYAPKYTRRVSALVAREKDTFPGKIGVDAHYSAEYFSGFISYMGGEERGVASFFQWGSPPRRAQSQADRTEKIRRVLFLRVCWPCFFFSPPSFLFPEKEKKGCGRLTAARGVRNSAPHTCIKPDRVVLP